MTLTDQLEILDDKIKANQDQYDLDREAAKIFSLSSKELGKCEYLTSADLGYIPGVVEKVKPEYYPLGEALNKGLKKMIKSIRLLNTTMIWCIILRITLVNIVCLILMKYHLLIINLMQ